MRIQIVEYFSAFTIQFKLTMNNRKLTSKRSLIRIDWLIDDWFEYFPPFPTEAEVEAEADTFIGAEWYCAL